MDKDQRTCPSASPFLVIAFSSPLPLGTGVMSAKKKRYVMLGVKALKRMLTGNYKMEMNLVDVSF